MVLQIFVLSIFFISLFNKAIACPLGCSCNESSISCTFLTKPELYVFLEVLKDSPFNETTDLSLASIDNFWLRMLPDMPKLRVLKVQSSPSLDDSDWFLRRNQFPELQTLHFKNCSLKTFPKALMALTSLLELDLSDNMLENLGADSIHIRSIQRVILRNNQIKSIGVHVFRYMPTLKMLDLSGNNMTRLVTSDFTSAVSLRELILRENKIELIETDTTEPMQQLETLDLSGNLLSEVRLEAQQNFRHLFSLNLSCNPLQIIREGFLQLPDLQVLQLDNCNISVVEAGAFVSLPRLHSMDIKDNPNLAYFSPYAFSNNTAFYRMNIQNSGFKRIPLTILEKISQLYIKGTQLDCSCTSRDMQDYGAITIVDWNDATCKTKIGAVQKLSHLEKTGEPCRDNLLTPFGIRQTATVGHSYRIYCANDGTNSKLLWISPNKTTIEASHPKLRKSSDKRTDYFTTTLLDPSFSRNHEERIHISNEYYGFDVVLENDAGHYECVSKSDMKTITRKIELEVVKPNIYLNASHVATTSVHLNWNRNLKIEAVDRVALRITASSEKMFKRQVQLSLYNMFRSYNLVNLSADKEYLICLEWYLTDNDAVIYSSCISQKTKPFKTVMQSLNAKLAIALIIILIIVVVFCCDTCIHQKVAYFSRIKKNAKMQQSVSGQSMLTQSSSADATTYENFQLSVTSASEHPLL
ncbi:Ig-like domain-containing protein [Caenorhabditis elegans]|uniref:Ig-like domain-containing protein n=1 Tax=Caenorhabditis elegans TaxID=6239 RepID=Q93539_CAEEL|nr:Ig-like domain-containing protein [Caenorhabditis elegans]CAB01749.2 Ig-like domain-containing protein [Caenorhabditis elegans]|eukprot:NP_510491.2 IG(immunoglobulin) and LRR(Leucine Rich Repeat) domains [Caenorhabditis elegans]